MVLILLVWIRFTFLIQFYYIFHSFHIFKISKHNVYLHTVRLTIWYQLFLQLWLVHTLFFPFHVINMQQLASWSIKLDINVLNRQLLRDSLIVDRITTSPSALIFGGERENYENPRVEIIANGCFHYLFGMCRDKQIWKYFYQKNVRSLGVSVRFAWNFFDI